LVTSTRSLGEPGWTPFAPQGIVHEQSAVQSNETISDQVWIEIPDDDLVALRTDFVVARVVTEEERRKRGNVIWGWEARDIVNLLDAMGNIADTSDSDAERGQ
jgi:hypothetical protein